MTAKSVCNNGSINELLGFDVERARALVAERATGEPNEQRAAALRSVADRLFFVQRLTAPRRLQEQAWAANLQATVKRVQSFKCAARERMPALRREGGTELLEVALMAAGCFEATLALALREFEAFDHAGASVPGSIAPSAGRRHRRLLGELELELRESGFKLREIAELGFDGAPLGATERVRKRIRVARERLRRAAFAFEGNRKQ